MKRIYLHLLIHHFLFYSIYIIIIIIHDIFNTSKCGKSFKLSFKLIIPSFPSGLIETFSDFNFWIVFKLSVNSFTLVSWFADISISSKFLAVGKLLHIYSILLSSFSSLKLYSWNLIFVILSVNITSSVNLHPINLSNNNNI